jgi:hypothetical protein
MASMPKAKQLPAARMPSPRMVARNSGFARGRASLSRVKALPPLRSNLGIDLTSRLEAFDKVQSLVTLTTGLEP